MALKTPFVGPDTAAGAPITPDLMDVKIRQNLEDLATQVDTLKTTGGGGTGPAGPAGPTGPEGPAGPQGDPGTDGADGADGAAGPAGPAGPKGDKGDTGNDGADGAVGPAGPKGDTGAAGQDGADGAVGPAGPKGDTGPKGDKGDPGDGAGGNANSIIALETPPTDLSAFANRAVIRVNTPPAWYEIDHEDTDQLDTIRYANAIQSNNRFGVNLVTGGSGFLAQATGQIKNFENVNLTLANSPIGAFYVENTNPSNPPQVNNGILVAYIKSADLPSDPANIWVRTYNGVPATNNELDTGRLDRGESITLNSIQYRVYRSRSALAEFGTGDLGQAARFFTQPPPASDLTSNVFEIFQDNKFLKQIDLPPGIPTDDADVSHGIDFVVFETDGPEVRTHNFAYQDDADNKYYEANINVKDDVVGVATYFRTNHPQAAERGRWVISFAGRTTSPFTKTVTHFWFKVGSNSAVEVPISRDSLVVNAFAWQSTSAVGSDYAGLNGATNPSIQYNFKFSDNTYAYSDAESVKREKVDKAAASKLVANSGEFENFALTSQATATVPPARLPAASADAAGIIELADNSEADAGTDNTKAMTPLQVKRRVDSSTPLVSTPQRVARLASDADSLTGEKVYVPEPYIKELKTVEITPQSFLGTELDGEGVGDRGWYTKSQAGFDFGSVRPALPDDFLLISNTRIYVKRNTQTDLSHIEIGGVEYALTRVPQAAGTKIIDSPDYAAGEPDVDYYTIAGAGLPAGDWDALRFKTSGSGSDSRTGLSFVVFTNGGNGYRYVENRSAQGINILRSIDFGTNNSGPSRFQITVDDMALDSISKSIQSIFIGDTEYSLTLRVDVGQTSLFITQQIPTSDRITAAGPFNKAIKIKFTDNTFLNWDDNASATSGTSYIPESPMESAGYFIKDPDDWQPDEYNAPPADASKDLKFQVEEEVEGQAGDIALTFVADGTDFQVENPFSGITRLAYGNTSTDADEYQRYSVRVPVSNFDDTMAPQKLKIKGKTYGFSYFETSSQGYATYRTPVITVVADRMAAAGVANNCNLQLANGIWLGRTPDLKRRRTVTKNVLADAIGVVKDVHEVPYHPFNGQKVRLLNAVAIDNGAIMTPATNTAGNPDFTGYLKSETTPVGTISVESDDIDGISCDFDGSGLLNGTVSVLRNSGSTKTPTFLTVRREFDSITKRYPLIAVGTGFANRWKVNDTSLDSSDEVRHFFIDDVPVKVNVEFSDNTKAWADTTFAADDTLAFNGLQWLLDSKRVLSEVQVQGLANTLIAAQFTNFNLYTIWVGTQTQYDAIAVKDARTMYLITA